MKYFKKFLIVGLFALFGVSFCNAGTYVTTGHYQANFGTYSGNISTSYYIDYNVVPFIAEDTGNGSLGKVYISCTGANFNKSQYISNLLAGKSFQMGLFVQSRNINYNGIQLQYQTKSLSRNDLFNNGKTEGNITIDAYGSLLFQKVYGYYWTFTNSSVGVDCANNDCTFSFDYTCTFTGNTVNNGPSNSCSCPSCPACEEQYTSLQCQQEYSLIPVSSVTENYCTANFDLISPSSCPISEGTGGTSRSALYLNNVQYAGASNIYVNFNDYLDWSTTYIDSGSSFVLDIDGYVADTGYMADILTIQEYHPSSEDFTSAFVGGLTLGLPYVIVALFVLFVRKLIKRIFKS